MWFCAFFSCITTSPEAVTTDPPSAVLPEGAKASGSLPAGAEPERSVAEDARQSCIAECIGDNQMRAVSLEVIRMDCERSCDAAHHNGPVEFALELSAEPPETPGGIEAIDRP